MSVNWMTLALLIVAVLVIRLAVNGNYKQAYTSLATIPLTPAQAQAQGNAANGATVSTATLARIG